MEKELRHSRSVLHILGTGVIAFTLWGFVKTIMILLLVPMDTTAAEPASEVTAGAVVFLVLLLLFFLLLLGSRLYIGMSARAEGKGERRGSAYVMIAFLFSLIQILLFLLTLVYSFKTGFSERTVSETAAGFIVEISSMVTMEELVFTAMKVKRLTKQMRGTE